MFAILRAYSSSAYDGVIPSQLSVTERANLMLDPVVRQGNGANIPFLHSAARSFQSKVAEDLMAELLPDEHPDAIEPERFLIKPITIDQAQKVIVSKHYYKHYLGLTEDSCRLLQPPPKGITLRFLSGYFAIPKPHTDPPSARAIFSGSQLSKLFTKPVSINLPRIPDLLHVIGRPRSRKPVLVIGDAKHCFHFYCLPSRWRAYTAMDWRTLSPTGWTTNRVCWAFAPMGFSRSPSWAEAGGWICIWYALGLTYAHNLPLVFDSPSLPSICHLKDAKSDDTVSVLWIDNFFHLCFSKEDACCYAKSLHFSMDVAGLKLKYLDIFYPTSMSVDIRKNETRPEYLGMEFALRYLKSSRDTDKQLFYLVWRHDPKRLIEWRVVAVCTCRGIAILTGRLVWDATICLKALCHISDCISMLRRAAKLAARAAGNWDAPYTGENDDPLQGLKDLEALNEHVQSVVFRNSNYQECWISIPLSLSEIVVVRICTDASHSGYCWMFFTEHGIDSSQQSRFGDWNNDLIKLHIYYKELLTGCMAIEDALRRFPSCRLHIVIAIDNTAAEVALARRFSLCKSANSRLCTMDKQLVERHSHLSVCRVPSLQNAADYGTRLKTRYTPVPEERIVYTVRVLNAAATGDRYKEASSCNDPWVSVDLLEEFVQYFDDTNFPEFDDGTRKANED